MLTMLLQEVLVRYMIMIWQHKMLLFQSDVFRTLLILLSLQPCPANSYTVKQASTFCQTCPTGYSCSNPSGIPIAIESSQSSCPSTPTCQTSQPTVQSTNTNTSPFLNPLLIAVGIIGAIFLLLCLISTSLLTCFCVRAKQRRGKKRERRRKRGGERLGREEEWRVGREGEWEGS